jgi:hypothetical protein
MNEQVKESKKKRRNAEMEFVHYATLAGFKVQKNFLPKFVCVREDNTIFLVDVMIKKTHKRRKDQHRLTRILKRYNIDVYKWSPDKNWLDNTSKHV